MEIGALSEIGRLEHVLLPDPDSYWIAESGYIWFENGKRKEDIKREKTRFDFLRNVVDKLDTTLRQESVKVSYVYFYPHGYPSKKKESPDRIVLECNPKYMSYCLRDYGIFTKKYFLYNNLDEEIYGDVSDKFAQKIEKMENKIIKTHLSSSSFVSDGNIGIVSQKNGSYFNDLVKDECKKIINVSQLDAPIDSFISFVRDGLFMVNYDLVKLLSKEYSEVDLGGMKFLSKNSDYDNFRNCDFSSILYLSNVLKKIGYSEIKIDGDYTNDVSRISCNILNLGNGKVIVIDPENKISKKLTKEGVDVINLKDISIDKLIFHGSGIRSMALPVKRNY